MIKILVYKLFKTIYFECSFVCFFKLGKELEWYVKSWGRVIEMKLN